MRYCNMDKKLYIFEISRLDRVYVTPLLNKAVIVCGTMEELSYHILHHQAFSYIYNDKKKEIENLKNINIKDILSNGYKSSLMSIKARPFKEGILW